MRFLNIGIGRLSTPVSYIPILFINREDPKVTKGC